MITCICYGLAIFLAVVAVVVSMKFRLKIAGHAHIPCPGLCWCRGPRWRRAQRLPASCHEAPSGSPLGCPGRPVPCCSRGAGYVQRAPGTRSSRARGLSSFEPSPPLGRLGCLPAHLQLRPGGDCRRLRWFLPRLLVEFREAIGEPALRLA